jgi:hypothetical protein
VFSPTRVVAGLLTLTLAACGGEQVPFEAPEVDGPPEVEIAVALGHAEQFETDVPDRPAGSGEEQAAAAYILGTLQQNGYFARLDAVPVEDLFRSTNVVAQPAGGAEPDAMVVVAYGTGPGAPDDPLALGLFLELARALNVAAPGHKVQFVALGAEFTDVEGGHLGSRRLARFLLDEEQEPFIVELGDITTGGGFKAGGDRAGSLEALAPGASPDAGSTALLRDPDVFGAAGFERALVSGGIEDVARVLLEFLSAGAA